MKEKEVQKVACDMLDLYGWLWWHVPAPMVAGKDGWRPYRKAAGLPDVFALHEDPPRFLILEFKGKGGRLSPEQREFLRLARNVAENIYCDDEMFRGAMGVYVVEPGNLDALRAILRSKVLT